MNAKVNFQILEQSISLYNTAHLRDIYSLAVDNITHIQTLLTCISKTTLEIKEYAESLNLHSYSFIEISNLVSVTSLLIENRLNSFDVEREKYENELKSISLPYTSEDLFEASSLIHETICWIQTMLCQIGDEVRLSKQRTEKYIHEAVFLSIQNLIHISTYLIDAQINTFECECKKYEVKMEE